MQNSRNFFPAKYTTYTVYHIAIYKNICIGYNMAQGLYQIYETEPEGKVL